MHIEKLIDNEIKAIKFKKIPIELVMNELKEKVLNVQDFVFDSSEAFGENLIATSSFDVEMFNLTTSLLWGLSMKDVEGNTDHHNQPLWLMHCAA